MKLCRRVPLVIRAELARQAREGVPMRELCERYQVPRSTAYQIVREQGVALGTGQEREAIRWGGEDWVNARLDPYDDAETRAWLGARLRRFLERWHDREGR